MGGVTIAGFVVHDWAESGRVETELVRGPSGQEYQVEIQAWWEGRKGSDVRVMVSIDDGGWRAFAAPSEDFIMAPDGSFVGDWGLPPSWLHASLVTTGKCHS